jgi:DNA-binding FadR family transcriptional regulator
LEAVREAVEDWVAKELIEVERDGETIVADEGELVDNVL